MPSRPAPRVRPWVRPVRKSVTSSMSTSDSREAGAPLPALLYDGATSGARPVTVQISRAPDGSISAAIEGQGVNRDVGIPSRSLRGQVGNARVVLPLSDGCTLEFLNSAALNVALAAAGAGAARGWVHRLEGNWKAELVAAARNDDELRGVLAHEVGHVVHRDAMRLLVQSSATALLMLGLLGDVNSASSLVAAVPTALVNAAYSRDVEREADAFALRWMARHHISGERLGDLLTRLSQQRGVNSGGLFASHPGLAERVRRAKGKR